MAPCLIPCSIEGLWVLMLWGLSGLDSTLHQQPNVFFLLLFFLGFFFLTCFYPTNPNNIQLFAEHTGHQLWKCEAASRRDWISEHRRNPNTKNDPRATVINWQRLVTVIIKIQRLFIQKKNKKKNIQYVGLYGVTQGLKNHRERARPWQRRRDGEKPLNCLE